MAAASPAISSPTGSAGARTTSSRQFTVGNGIGRYLNESDDAGLATNYLVLPTSAAAANNILVRPIFEAGGSAGYQHWWLPNLRSNVTFGISHEAIPSQLIGPIAATIANKQVITSHINLIWSPVAFVDTGIEYMWGQRQVVANIYGTEQALIGIVPGKVLIKKISLGRVATMVG